MLIRQKPGSGQFLLAAAAGVCAATLAWLLFGHRAPHKWVRMDVNWSRAVGRADSTQLWSALHVAQGAVAPAVAQARRKAIKDRVGNVTVSALIFWAIGRRETHQILQCYLERNLVDNGGLLSEVIFAHNDLPADDQSALDLLVSQHPDQYVQHAVQGGMHDGFIHYWNNLDPDRYYVKIDDDVIYIADGAIAAMLDAKLRQNWLFVSANVVNHGHMGWVHAHMGAMLPFAIEQKNGSDTLRMLNTGSSLDGSAAAGIQYELLSKCWESGQCAAAQHASFLYRYTQHSIDAYTKFDSWDFHNSVYLRWSINMVLFRAKDVVFGDEGGEDEEWIAKRIPEQRRQHCASAGKALVVHYAFKTQRKYLLQHEPGLGILKAFTDIARQFCPASFGNDTASVTGDGVGYQRS